MRTLAPDKTPHRIAGMFDAIAPRYDLLNHLLSAGIDRRWRARAIASLQLTGRETILDVCTGTADVALAARANGSAASGGRGAARVLGVDFSTAMLLLGMKKVQAAGESGRIVLARGDAMRLPVPDSSVDAATVAFGIRNVQQPEVACGELGRVLRPGGRLAILEFGMPRLPGLRWAYEWYFTRVLPRVGRLVSGHTGAYSYLPVSVGSFPSPQDFMTILRNCGFDDVEGLPLTFGIVYLYTGRRAAR
ncbi:MAG TPA: bifunctional demethylmenaquinone methyltransferase/2-methoxy-6-polyprenyl-1,4-benzoquinol methylase UbiE [Vicinamibacterales bacterium]|nr:bifunctional demethylmenaquinone methyltransferase/2-methoxy-6-polyprenyl-1,4-benzoquinol methylase UbiE [Vicinamibacterales bacterium]